MSQKAKRRLTAIFGGSLLLTVTVSLAVFLNSSNASPEEDALAVTKATAEAPRVPVEVTESKLGPISRILSSSSTIEAEQTAQVLAKVEGMVTAVKIREGDLVRVGQLLATIEDEEKKLALEKAELRLGKAEAEFQRAKLSVEEKLISRFDYEKSLYDRDLASSELETAKLELQYTQVVAPFSGRIVEKAVVVGKAVKKSEHLFTLADFNSLIARIYLPEKDVFRLETGQPAELLLESKAEVRFKGRIRDIAPVVDPKTGTVKVTLDVTSRSTAIRPGAFVRVNIITDTHDEAVLVPKVALLRENDADYLYLAVDGLAVKRQVRCGYRSGGTVEILDGISPGDRVVVAGHTALKENSQLEVLN